MTIEATDPYMTTCETDVTAWIIVQKVTGKWYIRMEIEDEANLGWDPLDEWGEESCAERHLAATLATIRGMLDEFYNQTLYPPKRDTLIDLMAQFFLKGES